MSKDYTLELARISTSPENYEGENWDDAMGLVVGLEAENNEHFKNIQALNSDRLQLEAENKAMRKALQDYIGLANVVVAFMPLMPEHPLYDSIRRDVLCYLERIKNPEQALAGQDNEAK